MGAIYRPGDVNRRRMVEKALEDLDPGTRDVARKLIESYRGRDLEKKLSDLVGFEMMRKLVEAKGCE